MIGAVPDVQHVRPYIDSTGWRGSIDFERRPHIQGERIREAEMRAVEPLNDAIGGIEERELRGGKSAGPLQLTVLPVQAIPREPPIHTDTRWNVLISSRGVEIGVTVARRDCLHGVHATVGRDGEHRYVRRAHRGPVKLVPTGGGGGIRPQRFKPRVQ